MFVAMVQVTAIANIATSRTAHQIRTHCHTNWTPQITINEQVLLTSTGCLGIRSECSFVTGHVCSWTASLARPSFLNLYGVDPYALDHFKPNNSKALKVPSRRSGAAVPEVGQVGQT